MIGVQKKKSPITEEPIASLTAAIKERL